MKRRHFLCLTPVCLSIGSFGGGPFPDQAPTRIPKEYLTTNAYWSVSYAGAIPPDLEQHLTMAMEDSQPWLEESPDGFLDKYTRRLTPATDLSPAVRKTTLQKVTLTLYGIHPHPSIWRDRVGEDIQLFGYTGSPASFPNLPRVLLWTYSPDEDRGQSSDLRWQVQVHSQEGVFFDTKVDGQTRPLFFTMQPRHGLPLLREGIYILFPGGGTSARHSSHEDLILMTPETNGIPHGPYVYSMRNGEPQLNEEPYLVLTVRMNSLLEMAQSQEP